LSSRFDPAATLERNRLTVVLGVPAMFALLIGGTSEGSPQGAGIIADANQLAGHSLGFLNPTLYALGALGAQDEFFHDITVGNNSFAGAPGYNATPGWDLASGWGTPFNPGKLALALAKQ
jgi:subtilase family serine protease